MAISLTKPKSNSAISLDFAKTKKLDSRIKFTRSSVGTYVDSDGLIKTATANNPRFNHKPVIITNIIKQSESFDDGTVWGTDNFGLTITANGIESPTGTRAAADILVEANTNTTHNRYQSVGLLSTTSRYTFSVFVKADTVTRIQLGLGYAGIGGGGTALFNLSSGTVISTTASVSDPGTNLSSAIVPYPNGWYRCSFTVTPTRGDLIYYAGITLINSSNQSIYQGNTANRLFAWGAQLETGSTASDYIPNFTGFVRSETKIQSLGLLIESSAQNLATYSEFPTSSWGSGDAVAGWAAIYTPNTTETLDPKGTNTAAKVIQNGTGWQRIILGINTPDGATRPHTWSLFVKRGNSDVCVLEHSGIWTGGGRVTWNFATETFTTGSPLNFGNYRFEKYPNGWYRISATFVPGTTSGAAWIFPGSDINGASVGAFTYVWGYQLESIDHGTVVTTLAGKLALGAATSYIYSNGAATTRTAEVCSMEAGFRAECNYDQLSAVTKCTFNSPPVASYLNRVVLSLSGAGFTSPLWWETGPNKYGVILQSISGLYDTAASTPPINIGDTLVLAFTVKPNDVTGIFNGTAILPDLDGTNNFTNRWYYMEIGCLGTANQLNGSIAKIIIYPKRVSNLELKEVI